MKINKKLCVLAALGVSTLGAQATFVFSTAQPTITIDASAVPVSGTLDFAFSSSSGSYKVQSGALTGFASAPDTFSTKSFGTAEGLTTGASQDFGLGASSSYVNPTGSATSLAVNGVYNVIVDYTLTTATAGNSDDIEFQFAYEPAGGTSYQTETLFGTINVVAVSVPEPAQTVAGSMLLGCGGLVFVGRRMFKKQAA
jgi:hypothetical protein